MRYVYRVGEVIPGSLIFNDTYILFHFVKILKLSFSCDILFLSGPKPDF